jgi:hypothetical protein
VSRRRGRAWGATTILAIAAVLAGCEGLLEAAPTARPQSFPWIVGLLGKHGVTALSWTSGDPGCGDASLSPTSIRFDAQGVDQPTPVTLRIYIFRNRETWERRLADVDTCAGAWATDPATFELLQVSPYVLTGQGPWPPGFENAVRTAITEAAGSGG